MTTAMTYAEDYMEVVYKLWEGSWEDDAVVADRAHRASSPTRPSVRRVRHADQNYKLDAVHLSEPSPQRTPVLYQAGTSPAGWPSRPATPNASSSPALPRRCWPARRQAPGRQAEAGRDPSDVLDLRTPYRHRGAQRDRG